MAPNARERQKIEIDIVINTKIKLIKMNFKFLSFSFFDLSDKSLNGTWDIFSIVYSIYFQLLVNILHLGLIH